MRAVSIVVHIPELINGGRINMCNNKAYIPISELTERAEGIWWTRAVSCPICTEVWRQKLLPTKGDS